jgi:hypothetical protein
LGGGYLLQGGAVKSEVVYAMAPVPAAAGIGALLLTYLARAGEKPAWDKTCFAGAEICARYVYGRRAQNT